MITKWKKSTKETKKWGVDIELVFLRELLDRVLIGDGSTNCEYNRVYIEADEDTRWEFDRKFKEKINRQLFMWDQFIDSMELEECYRGIFKIGYDIGK